VEVTDAAILRVGRASDKPFRFEPLDDARHRWRAHLLRSRQLAEGPWATENEHRQSRELSGGDTSRRIFPADVAQSMDRRRVEAIRRLD
jgi:hypothetical protein